MDAIPHIAWPIRVQGTAYSTVQQDTDDEVAAAVAVLCSFGRGTRIEQPEFGITDPTFQLIPIDTAEIERQTAVYEPRASLRISLSETGAGAQHVQIGVRIATTDEEG